MKTIVKLNLIKIIIYFVLLLLIYHYTENNDIVYCNDVIIDVKNELISKVVELQEPTWFEKKKSYIFYTVLGLGIILLMCYVNVPQPTVEPELNTSLEEVETQIKNVIEPVANTFFTTIQDNLRISLLKKLLTPEQEELKYCALNTVFYLYEIYKDDPTELNKKIFTSVLYDYMYILYKLTPKN